MSKQVKGLWRTLAWGQWLYGLFSAAIGGGAGAVTAGLTMPSIDPDHFAAGSHRWLMAVLWMFIGSAAVPFFAYLKQKPLPDKIIVETVKTTEVPEGVPIKVERTVESTTVEKSE